MHSSYLLRFWFIEWIPEWFGFLCVHSMCFPARMSCVLETGNSRGLVLGNSRIFYIVIELKSRCFQIQAVTWELTFLWPHLKIQQSLWHSALYYQFIWLRWHFMEKYREKSLWPSFASTTSPYIAPLASPGCSSPCSPAELGWVHPCRHVWPSLGALCTWYHGNLLPFSASLPPAQLHQQHLPSRHHCMKQKGCSVGQRRSFWAWKGEPCLWNKTLRLRISR